MKFHTKVSTTLVKTTHNTTLRLRSTVRAITRATASDDDLVSIQAHNLTTFNKAQLLKSSDKMQLF